MDINNFFENMDYILKNQSIKKAEEYIIGCLDKAKKEMDIPAILAIANELGGIYRVTNRFDEGKSVYTLALESIKYLNLENTLQHGTTLLNLAAIYSEENNFSEALRLYRLVDDIYKNQKLDGDYRVAALYNNISHVYDKLGDFKKALDYAEKSLFIMKNLKGNETELATTHTTIGLRLLKMKRLEEAKESFRAAEEIFLKKPGKPDPHYSATLNGMGELLYLQGKTIEAEDCFNRALDIIKESYGENKAYENVINNLNKVKECKKERKTGLELSNDFYNEYGIKMIKEKFPQYEHYMAVGLFGEGSECFSYDDEISEDHDFKPGFCLLLPDSIYSEIGERINKEYEKLTNNMMDSNSIDTQFAKGRRGVFGIESFFKNYIGTKGAPKDNVEWLFAKEISISTVTNGKVFVDNYGEVTEIRRQLLEFYPRDIYIKKVAALITKMSQAGQYNYIRSIKRKDFGAAYLSCSEFIEATISTIYMLNRTYKPFYKWQFRGMKSLKKLNNLKDMILELINLADTTGNSQRKIEIIEQICVKVKEELESQGLIEGKSFFLADYGQKLMEKINDARIRSLPITFDGN